jgi:hypothetical protein
LRQALAYAQQTNLTQQRQQQQEQPQASQQELPAIYSTGWDHVIPAPVSAVTLPSLRTQITTFDPYNPMIMAAFGSVPNAASYVPSVQPSMIGYPDQGQQQPPQMQAVSVPPPGMVPIMMAIDPNITMQHPSLPPQGIPTVSPTVQTAWYPRPMSVPSQAYQWGQPQTVSVPPQQPAPFVAQLPTSSYPMASPMTYQAPLPAANAPWAASSHPLPHQPPSSMFASAAGETTMLASSGTGWGEPGRSDPQDPAGIYGRAIDAINSKRCVVLSFLGNSYSICRFLL